MNAFARHSLRSRWVGFTTFVLRAWQDIVRYAILTIAPPAVTTALYLIVFGDLLGDRVGPIDGVDYRSFIAPGLIIMPVIASSYSQAALSFFTAKFHRILDEHLVSPQPSWLIVVSYVSGGVIRGILVGIAVALVALLLAHPRVANMPLAVAAMLLCSIFASLAGFLNAVFARSFEQINAVLAFVLAPLSYCGGVFYAVASLPWWAQTLSFANPIFYMVDLFRHAILGGSTVSPTGAVVIMLLASAGLYFAAAALIERGVGIKE